MVPKQKRKGEKLSLSCLSESAPDNRRKKIVEEEEEKMEEKEGGEDK